MTKQQMDRLYDYTKFHIGLYAALMTALIAFLKVGRTTTTPCVVVWSLKATLVCFALARACGGIIGSTISLSEDAIAGDHKIGPFNSGWWKADWWAHLEHWIFWVGIAVSTLGFVVSH